MSELPAKLRLSLIEHEHAFLALEPYWDALLERSAIRTPFLTWDWVSLWWRHYRDDFVLRIAVLRAPVGDEVLAIAPFVLGRGVDGGRRYLRHLTFIGGMGEVVSEGLDLIIPCGEEARMAPLLAQVIERTRGEWDIVELSALHDESPNGAVLREAMQSVGQVKGRFDPLPCFMYELPDTWEKVLAAMSSRTRRQHRAHWKVMEETHAGRFLLGGGDVSMGEKPMGEVFVELLRLHAMRYNESQSSFLHPRAISFHQQIITRWGSRGRVIMPYIELDGRVAAARYGFTHFGRYWDYQTGFDPAYSGISLGTMGMSWTMQCAIHRELSVFDHLPGNQEHKRHRSTMSRTVHHLEAFNAGSPRAMAFVLLRSVWRVVAGNPDAGAKAGGL
jgi:CelD/BcsL family acetyltransferase involved in cellulose biosynthesis